MHNIKGETTEPIVRVQITNDCEWETEFIPWLEDKQMNKIGVEDGVFVATVDPALRHLQPPDEDSFITYCLDNKLDTVSQLSLKKYKQEGIFEYIRKDCKDCTSFKDDRKSDLDAFRRDNCCTPYLVQDDVHRNNLFTHLDYELDRVTFPAQGADASTSSRSSVLLEESALKMSNLYQQYRQNTAGFTWERKQRTDLEYCHDMECIDDVSVEVVKKMSGDASFEPKRTRVRTAKDIDLLCYGHGIELPSDSLPITPKLKMSRIFNILWLLPQHYPGLHSPYLYIGDTHSFFPIHLEDGSTFSLNYLHIGKEKIWVFIPPWATELLEFHLNRSHVRLLHASCSNVLGHKTILPTTTWLKERNIPFKVLVQRPGDLVVIYPSTPHFGFNSGPNIAQAINVATISWIKYGINSKKCPCIPHQIHIDMQPLVAAFRKDLLVPFKHGDIIPTPDMLKGIQLLSNRIASRHNVCKDMSAEEQDTVKCPALFCNHTISKFPGARKELVKHVKSTHKPISGQLLKEIVKLFQE